MPYIHNKADKTLTHDSGKVSAYSGSRTLDDEQILEDREVREQEEYQPIKGIWIKLEEDEKEFAKIDECETRIALTDATDAGKEDCRHTMVTTVGDNKVCMFCGKLVSAPVQEKEPEWEWYNNIQNTGWEKIIPSDMDAIIAHGLTPPPRFRKIIVLTEG